MVRLSEKLVGTDLGSARNTCSYQGMPPYTWEWDFDAQGRMVRTVYSSSGASSESKYTH